LRYGIHAIVGESFAEIFAGNCKALGIAAVTVSRPDLDQIYATIEENPDTHLVINLESQTAKVGEKQFPCHMAEDHRQAFLQGLWNANALLKSNEASILTTAKNLPYIN